jgi:hypothetical protein
MINQLQSSRTSNPKSLNNVIALPNITPVRLQPHSPHYDWGKVRKVHFRTGPMASLSRVTCWTRILAMTFPVTFEETCTSMLKRLTCWAGTKDHGHRQVRTRKLNEALIQVVETVLNVGGCDRNGGTGPPRQDRGRVESR